jgi:5-methylphenazine-1-carboxylate 1-monooxygenase
MTAARDSDVIIIGAGIGGCALALALHAVGIRPRIFEAAPELKPLGVGINLLPHAVRDLAGLRLASELAAKGIETQEYRFYTCNGQLVYREPRGRFAGYEWPQISIHRGDLHEVLLTAVRERLGPRAISLGHRCTAVEQDGDRAIVRFAERPPVAGAVAIACDGVHSVARSQMHPAEAVPRYEAPRNIAASRAGSRS